MDFVGFKPTLSTVLLSGTLLRLALTIYGMWQDANFAFKYTDVDYFVYTDASRQIYDGNSPFSRATYRYTPLLAYSMLPTITWFFEFGKLVFVAVDIAIGFFIYKILTTRGFGEDTAIFYTAVWIFNPIAVTISTRGNADPIIGLLCVLALFALMKKRIVLSALLYGLAVHFKIYPIVYAPAFLKLLDARHYRVGNAEHRSVFTKVGLNRERILFALVSGALFLVLGCTFYWSYGYEFLYETYLYHLIRRDNRHNFSVYFYDLYLSYSTDGWFNNGLMAFLPQFGLIFSAGYKYGRDMPFAMFLCTYVFVVFNKVCTAQYFLWYVCLMPLVLPSTKLRFKWTGLQMLLAWGSAEVYWLLCAKALELDGQNVFLQLWIASFLFFSVNVWIICQFICSYVPRPIFEQGKLNTTIAEDKRE